VVVCTHSLDNYSNLQETLASILRQTIRPVEILVVVDGNAELAEKIRVDYINQKTIQIVLLEKNRGISEARNAGILKAKGEIIAFIDDDATADKNWIKELAAIYQKYQVVAVGGKILPVWINGKMPDYFPEELYWLVGVTNIGFAEEKVVEVRNTFGPNMSFKKEVFQKAGLFSRGFGFSGTSFIQAEEPEMSLRMKKHFGQGVMYNPGAIVYHKINPSKARFNILIKRAFFQGYSKALLQKMEVTEGSLKTESNYLRFLLLKRIPSRLLKVYRISEIKKGFTLIAAIVGVGMGYIYCRFRRSEV
jgi:glucosyl-dolichyl phosphate glucuronosyltransferase